ncbi:hypothetical protein P4E94_19275 [Pontiellaceae bacterium B12219]|nr:hypothetical protein [Pontiellaceae bacterium B12219]
MGLFDRFRKSNNDSDEITLEGLQANAKKLDQASSNFLQSFGPSFTGTPDGHIVTDIAGASSIAGLMILRSTNIDLSSMEPGNVILGEEINQKQEPVFRYISIIGQNMGVDPKEQFNDDILENYKPMFETVDLTEKLEKSFYSACEKTRLSQLYYPIAAALTAMKLVGAGMQMGILDPKIGKNIALYHVVAGSKTIPRPV